MFAHPLHWSGLKLSSRDVTCLRHRCSPLLLSFTLSRRATVHLTLFALNNFARRRVSARTLTCGRGSHLISLRSLFARRRLHPDFYQLRLQATTGAQTTLVSLTTLQVLGQPPSGS